MWQRIYSLSEIPADRDLHLAVLEGEEVHSLAFPCRRNGQSWVDARTRRPVEVYPTHWREWPSDSKKAN